MQFALHLLSFWFPAYNMLYDNVVCTRIVFDLVAIFEISFNRFKIIKIRFKLEGY